MKKIVYALLTTVTALVLLFTYRTSHIGAADPVVTQPASTPDTSGAAPGAASSNAPGAASGATALADGSYTGATARTPYGPVAVSITVSGGRIADVQVPQYPSDNPRDQQISGYALPMLVSETTAAQSADIQMVSGATYTSEGYRESLQSAIDQARS